MLSVVHPAIKQTVNDWGRPVQVRPN